MVAPDVQVRPEQKDVQRIGQCKAGSAARRVWTRGGLNCPVVVLPIVFSAPVLNRLRPSWLVARTVHVGEAHLEQDLRLGRRAR